MHQGGLIEKNNVKMYKLITEVSRCRNRNIDVPQKPRRAESKPAHEHADVKL